MYNRNVKLQDNEVPAVVNKETGEIKELGRKRNNIPDGKMIHRYNNYSKVSAKAIEYLESELENEEMGIVFKMIHRADYESNAMLPLNDEYSHRQISEEFGIGRHKVKKVFEKLFKLGVYAQIKVANGINSEYWTLNPYISWKGKFIDRIIDIYFSKTKVARYVKEVL